MTAGSDHEDQYPFSRVQPKKVKQTPQSTKMLTRALLGAKYGPDQIKFYPDQIFP